jgi:hypothetical protein
MRAVRDPSDGMALGLFGAQSWRIARLASLILSFA